MVGDEDLHNIHIGESIMSKTVPYRLLSLLHLTYFFLKTYFHYFDILEMLLHNILDYNSKFIIIGSHIANPFLS